jgi:hypothetical protein
MHRVGQFDPGIAGQEHGSLSIREGALALVTVTASSLAQ